MKTFTIGIVVLIVMALGGKTWAGFDDTNDARQQMHLELNLVDGSRIIGVPSFQTLPVQTSYAKMDIPLRDVLTITVADDHETASVDMRNGDKLKGVISLAPIKLETLFGRVALGIEHVRSFRVVLFGVALPESLRKGLVLYYAFDRDEGEKVNDGSGSNNHGKICGAKWTKTGKTGGALHFDGKGAYVTANDAASLHTANLTVSTWTFVANEADFNEWTPVIQKQIGANHWAMHIRPRVFYVFAQTSNRGLIELQAPSTIQKGTWHHFALTYDGSQLKSYQDGNLMSASAPDCGFLDYGNEDLQIGRQPGYPRYFNGLIDEVIIFNRALAAEDVRRIYDAQK